MGQLQSHRQPAAGGRAPAPARSSRVPLHFFVTAILFFALGTATGPWAAAKLADYFYQLPVLAWVHTFTLGWITSAILGLIYYYAPSGKDSVRFPRLAGAQFLLYLLGASGVIAHFALGSWDGVWMAGVVVALSVVLFAINVVPWIAPRLGRGAAETGLLTALFFLLCATCLGALLAFDKGRNLLPGTVLRNLSAHAHLAVMGWVTIAICAASYRFVTGPAGANPAIPRSAVVQIFALAAATAGLFVGLITGTDHVTWWAAASGAVLVAYALVFKKFSGLRAASGDPASRHTTAGLFFLLMAVIGGIWLAGSGVNSAFDARLAAAYGVAGLLGWISNFIIAMSYQVCPGLVARVRGELNWPEPGAPELTVQGGRALVFYTFNSGVLVMAAGLLAGQIAVAQTGACLIAIGGLAYSAAMGWTLSHGYRRGAAPASDSLLRAAQE